MVIIEILQSIPIGLYGPIAVLVSAVATVATTLFVNRKQKRLWYSSDTVLMVGEKLSTRVQVSVNGESLPQVYICLVKLLYRGSEPLLETDFRSPIDFEFEDSRVLDVEITQTNPSGIKARTRNDKDNRFRLNPVALNDNTRLYARVLLTNPAQLNVSSHIVGVKIQHESQRDKLPNRLMFFSPISLVLALASIGLEESYLGDGPLDGVFIPFVLIFTLVAIALFLGSVAIVYLRDR